MFNKIIQSTSLKFNIFANLFGSLYSAIISIIFVPIYFKYIGADGYGLIGVFTSLQVVLSLLDNGFTTALNKEIARLIVLPNTEKQIKNLVKTLGTVYWLVALLIGVLSIGLSRLLSQYWVHSNGLSTETIRNAFVLLSLSAIFQLPSGFYSGGLLGLQRQVVLNILRILFATLRSLGVVFILIYISKSILSFFFYSLLISIIQAFTYKYFLWYYIPKSEKKATFDIQELKKIRSFYLGMTAIGITGVLLTQIDKIILSKILILSHFGNYTLAFTIGSIIYMLIGPISQSYFPKFNELLAQNKLEELKKSYHQSCQIATLLIVPFTIFLALFSKEVLFIWSRNEAFVTNISQTTVIISISIGLHSLMFMPYMICLTYNNTKLPFFTNIIILIFLIPSMIYLALNYGALGGALSYLGVNIIYFFINPILVHKKFLKGESMKWYWNDTLKPAIASFIILIIARIFLSFNHFNLSATIVFLIIIGLISFIIAMLYSNEIRSTLFQQLNLFKSKHKYER